MTTDSSIFNHPTLFAITVQLIVSVTAILVVGLVADGLMHRQSAAVRHRLWLIAFISLAVVPGLIVLTPKWNEGVSLTDRQPEDRDDRANLHALTASPRSPEDLSALPPRVKPTEHTAESPTEQTPMKNQAESHDTRNPDTSIDTESERSGTRREVQLWEIILTVWLIGMCLTAFPLLRGWWMRSQLFRLSHRFDDPDLRELLANLQNRLGIRAIVEVRLSQQELMPMTWGTRHPLILLPASSRDWTLARLKLVLLHELAHIQRLDFLQQTLARIVCCVYWFHPLVWQGLRRCRRYRERACDDLVVSHGIRASEYARELVGIAHDQRIRPVGIGLAMARPGELEGRLNCLFNRRRSHQAATWSATTLISVVATITVAALAATDCLSFDQPSRQDDNALSDHANKHVDELGDPLPLGALRRFGTTRLRHPSISCQELAITQDGQTLFSLDDTVFAAWDTQTGQLNWQLKVVLMKHERDKKLASLAYGVAALAISHQDSKVFIPGPPGTIRSFAFDSPNETIIKIQNRRGSSPLDKAFFRSIDVSPDGKLLAVGCAEALVIVDSNGVEKYRISNAPAKPFDEIDDADFLKREGDYCYAKFSPNGKRLAIVTSGEGNVIRFLDSTSGDELSQVQLDGRLQRMEFSSDGSRMAIVLSKLRTQLLDIESNATIWSKAIEPSGKNYDCIAGLSYCQQIQQVAVSTYVGGRAKVELLNAEDGETLHEFVQFDGVQCPSVYSPDGSDLYSSGTAGRINRWDTTSFETSGDFLQRRTTGVCVASPHGSKLAVVGSDQVIRVYESARGAVDTSLAMPGILWRSCALSSDESKLAAGGSSDKDVHVVIWDLSTEKPIHHYRWPKGDDVHTTIETLSFSDDNSLLAAALFRQDSVKIWHVGSGEQLTNVPHKDVYCVDFEPDSSAFVTVGWDGFLREWDLDQGELSREHRFEPVRERMGLFGMAVAVPHDGRIMTTIAKGGVIRVINSADLTLHRQMFVEGGDVSFPALDVSRDGLLMATGASQGPIALYDLVSGDCVWKLGMHEQYVFTVSFSDQDTKLLSGGGSDETCYLWDLRPASLATWSSEDLYNALNGNDATVAYQALWTLQDRPEIAIKLARESLVRSRVEINPDRVAELVQQLDAEEFKERLAAEQELGKGGRAVIPLLTESLDAAKSEEQRERLQLIVESIQSVDERPSIRREIALLIRIDSNESRRLLEELAKQSPGSLLSDLAASALRLP